jgi:exodeoxyribonuclease VII large subunit
MLALAALAERRESVALAAHSLERHAPQRRLAYDRQQIDDLSRRLSRALSAASERRHLGLAGLKGRLAALSPQATLARGYAVARRADSGAVLTSPNQAPAGTTLTITLRDGELVAVTTSSVTEESANERPDSR